mmetsp:Transcript_108793/g.249556  ORF Transcript_108793/g.249556 Transcript_108793/m.249556 type:complete len:359 (+) Transcript_108793:3148-4224(+)
MDLVALPLDVEDDWGLFALDVADHVAVEGLLFDGAEDQLHGEGGAGADDAAGGRDRQHGLALALVALLIEGKTERNVFLVGDMNRLPSPRPQQQAAKIDVRTIHPDPRILDGPRYHKRLIRVAADDTEHPVGFVDPGCGGDVFEDHLVFFAGVDGAAAGGAAEGVFGAVLGVALGLGPLLAGPDEIVLLRRRVENVEPARVLHLGTQRLKINNPILGVQRLQRGAALSVGGRRQFKMAQRTQGATGELDFQRLLAFLDVRNVARSNGSKIFDLLRGELENKLLGFPLRDGAGIGRDAVGSAPRGPRIRGVGNPPVKRKRQLARILHRKPVGPCVQHHGRSERNVLDVTDERHVVRGGG